MDYATPFGIIALAGLIHASFQLGVSMMTLLSGHSLSQQRSGRRTLALIACFFCGSFVMTLLTVSLIAFIVSSIWTHSLPSLIWTVSSSLLLGLGVVVWAVYYRRGSRGTELWISRSMAHFLQARTKATQDGAEAFSLGLTSVLAEFLFVLPPAFAAALAITTLPPVWQLPGLALYSLAASLGLGIVVVLVGSGRHIGTIQRWRETHKRFLQFAAGGGLIILGFFIYVTYSVVPSMLIGNF